MNNQDQVPTIAELWGKLQFKSAQERDRESVAAIYPDKADNWRAFAQKARDEYAPIRQQLLERCKILYGMQPIWSGEYWFVNPPRAAALGLKSHELKNMGSALLFMDWELEHREKEVSGD